MEKVNVTLGDIFEFINSSRPIKEGEAVYNAGHVTMCGVKENGEIVAVCLQTSNTSGAQHKIEITLCENVNNWKTTCSCKAGLGGKCKHITAVLIHLNRIGEVEKLSCTDVEQVWGKSGPKPSEEFDYSSALKMKDFCHPITKTQKLAVNEAEMIKIDKQNLELLKSWDGDGESSLSKIFKGRPTSIMVFDEAKFHNFQLIQNFIEKSNMILDEVSASITENEKTKFYLENVANDDVKNIYNQSLGQNNNYWHQARKYRITGSNCYTFYTYSKNVNPDWKRKIYAFLNPNFSGNAATRYGKEQEEVARKAYAEISNQEVKECGLVVNPKVPWLGFSADGITDSNLLIEIKCPVAGQCKSISDILHMLPYLIKNEDDEFVLKENHSYFAQVQLGLCLLNLEYCEFVVFSSYDKSIHVIRIKYNVEYCKQLLTVLKNVYFKQILPFLENK